MANLHAHHEKEGERDFGVDVINLTYASAKDLQVWDMALAKHWAIKLATDAVVSILRVDQIIMAKPAGGPKMPKGQMAM